MLEKTAKSLIEIEHSMLKSGFSLGLRKHDFEAVGCFSDQLTASRSLEGKLRGKNPTATRNDHTW